MSTEYDVITIGETMLRLTPPHSRRLEQARQFAVEVGGSESNTAVGLARLGLRVAWLSRLPDNPLGRLVTRTLAQHGVDTSHVRFSDQGRLGLYFLEEATPPRSSRVIYDRKGSAFSEIQPADLPDPLFVPGGARLLHLTGITPALSRTAAKTLQRALALAKQAGWTITFDLNYRRALWSPQAARRGCHEIVEAADLLIAPLRDLSTLFGFGPQHTEERIVAELASLYPDTILVLTLGAAGALAYRPADVRLMKQEAVPVEGQIGRIGGGDAFSAGFLYGFLSTEDDEEKLRESLRWGVAMAALKYTIPGDMPLIEKEEVLSIVEQLRGSGPGPGAPGVIR